MNPADINKQVVARLTDEFKFKPHGEHIREGVCPSCSKKSLWTWQASPGMIQCNRTNNCGWSATGKDLFPDLFENLNKKYPATVERPTQTADVYLSLVRGFDVSKIQGWYEQGKYWHPKGDKGTATVRFYLDADKTVMWERLIDDVTITDDDGDAETRNKNFKGKFKGLWWAPPGMSIEADDTVYWCEGILDAIALNLSGVKAVAIMSSGTFPDTSLAPHLKKGVTWVIALDNDTTGRKSLQKHARRLRDLKETVAAALSSETEDKCDWNDLYKKRELTDEAMRHYRFLGALELAPNHVEKAVLLWRNDRRKIFFVYHFGNSTYSLKIDPSEYQKIEEREHGTDPLKAEKIAFMTAAKLKEIATFRMDFLYFQRPENGEDGQYFFRLNFSNRAAEVQLPFPGKTFGSAGDFKKLAMHKAPGAQFTGSNAELDYMYRNWMGRIPKIVKTIDYVGFDRETQAYVYTDFAVQSGKIVNLNKESFFQLKQQGIKTMVDIKQKLSNKKPVDWLPDFQTAFGNGGLVALSWWFGCLFVEQVRHDFRSYPFFEVVGEAGSGKSDMVDFLWKLLGREGESFNPNSSTLPGRTRKMAEVSNLPVVFNEVDNEQAAEEKHIRKFNWDEQKDLYDGEFGRVTGVKSQDNSTKKPSFKAGLMIVQNIPVIASEAILSRIVHLNFDRSHHSPQGKMASDKLNMINVTDVSGFLLHAVQQAEAVLKRFRQQFKRHRATLQSVPAIKMQRIVENHAKIMAFADCLPLVLPISDDAVNSIHGSVIAMAMQRQDQMNEDHPIVQQFWATFDYLNSKTYRTHDDYDLTEHTMNHSHRPEHELAVNLEYFRQRCVEMKLETIDSKDLRRHLPTSRKRMYLRNEPIRSRIENRTVRCWVFKH